MTNIRVAAAVIVMLLTASCGNAVDVSSGAPGVASSGPQACAGWSRSLVSDRGGQATPIEAVQWVIDHGDLAVSLPRTGWQIDTTTGTGGVTVRSGRHTLHVLQGPDKTWQVDSGRTCDEPSASPVSIAS